MKTDLSPMPPAAPTPSGSAPGWFREAAFGLFIHFGPYAEWGRGEQVLLREWLDQRDYAAAACAWNPQECDPEAWCRTAKEMGCGYAVLTTRHHDGYCLWNTNTTDYSTARQAPKRDLVAEFVEACRNHGLRVGLYYSWADFRIPAYFEGPARNPDGWAKFLTYVHDQVLELVSNYGQIDMLWFDGEWPHSPEAWQSASLVRKVRQLQPSILINNRLGMRPKTGPTNAEGLGEAADLGDFGTPEHHITADPNRLWESCQVSTWRLWGFATGERWRPADLLLDMLTEAASKGGNLLLNVGPRPDGQFPAEFVDRAKLIGDWMSRNGEAVRNTDAGGERFDFTTYGRSIRRGNLVYLIFRFWDGTGRVRFPGLASQVRRATLLTTGQDVEVQRDGEFILLSGLPKESPEALFPVIRLECEGTPKSTLIGKTMQWTGDPLRYMPWARVRGDGVMADGSHRPA